MLWKWLFLSLKGQIAKKWLASFMRKHLQVAFRIPVDTLALKTKECSKENVLYFFH